MSVRQGLRLGAKQMGAAEKPTFRALVEQNFKLRHEPNLARLDVAGSAP